VRQPLNVAKHLFELNDHVSRKKHVSGFRPSASMAPASMYQLSISCWPDSSIAARDVLRHVS